MKDNTTQHGELNWLLEDLIQRVVGARHAVVLSADGLLLGRSAGLSRDDSEHLSAMASAFQSLARGQAAISVVVPFGRPSWRWSMLIFS